MNDSKSIEQKCRLCGKVGPICKSHIVPKFYIRNCLHYKQTGSTGQLQPFLMLKSTDPDKKDGARQGDYWVDAMGMREKMLCKTCESEFSTYEDYVKSILYGKVSSPPLRKLQLGTSLGGSYNHKLIYDIRDVAGIEFRLLRLFQLSILWRASVAKGYFFRNVSVGPRHEQIISSMLKRKDPGDGKQYCCAMIDLRYHQYMCEDFIDDPDMVRIDGYRAYRILICGYLYVFYVGSHSPPDEALGASVQPSGKMQVVVADAELYLRRIANALGGAGKLVD